MAETRPKYEAPVVINLGNLAKGAGAVCSKGKGQIVVPRARRPVEQVLQLAPRAVRPLVSVPRVKHHSIAGSS